MCVRVLGAIVLSLVCASSAFAADHKVEKLAEAAPADELSPEIASLLAAEGVQVTRGAKTGLYQIWLVKEAAVVGDFKPTAELLYPMSPGQLIGVVRVQRKSSDFRDQDIAPGVYTLRYSQQPVDGAHVGTSPTRDFLVLTRADLDRSPGVLGYKELVKASAETAGSNHPLLWSMKSVQGESDQVPSIRHVEEQDWWIVRLETKGKGQDKRLPFDLVVVGKAEE